MIQISADILALTSEALLLTQGEKICFANAAAKKLFGEGCENRSLDILLPQELITAQASSFVADARIAGKRHIVRVSRHDGLRAYFISEPSREPLMLNDALIYSMRSTLMTMCMSADFCRLRAEDIGNPELRAGIASLSQSYFRMTRLIENIGTAKSVLDGTLRFSPELLDIGELCGTLIDQVNVFLREPELVFGGRMGMYIEADRDLVRQLLLNLLSNCLLHAKGCTRISVNLLDVGECVVLSVTDDGCGINSDELHSTFNRYVHGYSMSGLVTGAGLGLTVVRGIADRHKGTLLLESRPNHGTSVRVSFAKRHSTCTTLRSPELPYGTETRSVLTGLSDYLPEHYYIERYLD